MNNAHHQNTGIKARARFYWTLIVAAILFIFIGIPTIAIGYILRWTFGIEDFVFPSAQLCVRVYVWSTGARVHVSGLEHIDPHQTYVFITNHQSMLDPPLLFAFLSHNIGALGKKELARIPIFGQGMSLAHIIPIDRSNHEKALASLQRGVAMLRKGHSLMTFPEGTRSIDGRVKEFKKGTFFMALEAAVPIIPVVINDTRFVMRKGESTCIPGDVWVEVLPPINTIDYTKENIDELVSRVRDMIVARVKLD